MKKKVQKKVKLKVKLKERLKKKLKIAIKLKKSDLPLKKIAELTGLSWEKNQKLIIGSYFKYQLFEHFKFHLFLFFSIKKFNCSFFLIY